MREVLREPREIREVVFRGQFSLETGGNKKVFSSFLLRVGEYSKVFSRPSLVFRSINVKGRENARKKYQVLAVLLRILQKLVKNTCDFVGD